MRKNVMKILVLGDQGVGKTSLICAIISEMSTQIPKTYKKVVLPPDMCQYSKDIFTELIDTSPDQNIQDEISNSDLVLLVYDISSQESITRLEQHWMPIIVQHNKNISVVIVGNKLDKIELQMDEEHQYVSVKTILSSMVKRYKQVQMGIECSAYYDRNVKKVLNSAQRAILYPLKPLYDLTTKQIRPKFKKALVRIFRILDKQFTGKLSDHDLSSLQERVFQTELNIEDIKAIKAIIQKEVEEEHGNCITVNGFIAFQKKCIEMLKIQICWSILRYFKYNNDLELNNIDEQFIIHFQQGESLELSNSATNFLHKIYAFASKNADQNTTPMQKLFESSHQVPLEQFKGEFLELQKFTLNWHLFSLLNYRQCYKSLLYLGYEHTLEQCFKISRGKTTYPDLLKLKDRRIFSVVILQNTEYNSYVDPLFDQGVFNEYLVRNTHILSHEQDSKVLLLFKIKKGFAKKFFHENILSKKIDLVIYFENPQEIYSEVKELQISEHTMVRKITKEVAQKQIRMHQLSQLNLKSLPVTYTKQNYNNFLSFLYSTFEKIEQGYSLEKINRLKKQSQKFYKMLALIGVIAAGVGIFAYKKKILDFKK